MRDPIGVVQAEIRGVSVMRRVVLWSDCSMGVTIDHTQAMPPFDNLIEEQ